MASFTSQSGKQRSLALKGVSVDYLIPYQNNFIKTGSLKCESMETNALTLPPGTVIDIGKIYGSEVYRSITVDSRGKADATTIKDAVALAYAIVPPPAAGVNGVHILIHPGVYMEDNPIAIGTGVTISGVGGISDARIIGMNAGPVFTMSGTSLIERVAFFGCDICIESSSGTPFVADAYCVSCNKAVRSTGTSIIQTSRVPSIEIGVAAYEVDGPSAEININAGSINGFSTVVPIGIHAMNGGHVNVNATRIQGVDVGIKLESGAVAHISSTVMENGNTAFHIGDSVICEISAVTIHTNGSWTRHIYAPGPNAIVRMSGGTILTELIEMAADTTSNMIYTSPAVVTESATTVTGNFYVGSSVTPTVSSFGGGEPNVIEMVCYRNDNLEVGNWTDITSDLQDPTISNVSMFSGVGVDQCFYIGRTDKIFHGFVIYQDIALAGGALEFSYWNGAAWVVIPIMVYEYAGPHRNMGTAVFRGGGGLVDGIQIGRTNGWATKTINGLDDMYAIRCRISSAVTTVPRLIQARLLTSACTIQDDGFQYFSGLSRVWKNLGWHINLTQPGTSSPGDQDVRLSNTLDVGLMENSFVNGKVDRIGFAVGLPLDIDTSLPIILEVIWICTSTGVGENFVWHTRWGYSKEGDQLYIAAAPTPHSTERVLNTIVPASTIEKVQGYSKMELSVEDFSVRPSASSLQTNLLWITIERDGTTGEPLDTFGGDVAIVALSAFYGSWCNGGTYIS